MRRREGPRLDPEQLGEGLAAGDPRAAGALHDTFDEVLCRYLNKRFGAALSPAWRDDVIGKVLGRIMNNPQNFRPGRLSLAGFLKMCVFREAKKKVEGEKGRERRAAEILSPLVPSSDTNGDGVPPWLVLSNQEEQSRRLSLLHSLIPRLTEEHQEVVLHYLEHGDAYSGVLALKRGERKETIQTRLVRAKLALASLGRSVQANWG